MCPTHADDVDGIGTADSIGDATGTVSTDVNTRTNSEDDVSEVDDLAANDPDVQAEARENKRRGLKLIMRV
ncbi:hypothetical protein CYMTET_11167 [Cymbomonas tetramitiformis]|uniref:Uncharacterized protein n=1 Tax=Cymbomonas tetramitiformis TaxID=36881 RepID=A0AAE0GMV3_9CHLO|nr:hypothetical protein CYMTET_11167 [Cymbomonas tetramitiformis]